MPNRIPSPPGHPLLGSLNDMRQDFLGFLLMTTREYGSVVRFRAGPKSMVLISDPEMIGDILVKHADQYHKTRSTKQLLAPLLGNGLVTLEGVQHQQHRRIMQPSFHTRQVQLYTQTVLDHTQKWLNQRQDGDVIDLVPAFADLMMDIVVATFFSATLTETQQMRSALHAFSHALELQVRSPIPLPQWLPTEHNRILKNALTLLNSTVHRLITERRGNPNPPHDLLTGLLTSCDEETGQLLTDQEIRDEIATIFFAGYETTTTTLAWLWYLLATHPDVHRQLYAEITQAPASTQVDTSRTLPALSYRLPYLDLVLKEVQRLYPAAWLFDREPIQQVTLGGYTLPAGQTLFISPFIVHRSPAYFDSPDAFKPQRFAHDFEKQLPRFAYFPFGGGMRVCIGQTFALHTLALVVTTLIPKVRFELVPGQTIRPAASATLVPANGIQMRIQRTS